MLKILIGAAVAAAAYRARKNGTRVSFDLGTIGFHVGSLYVDFHRSFGRVGMFWCVRDADGAVVERGWFSQNGSWRIESVNGAATGRWGYLRGARRCEHA